MIIPENITTKEQLIEWENQQRAAHEEEWDKVAKPFLQKFDEDTVEQREEVLGKLRPHEEEFHAEAQKIVATADKKIQKLTKKLQKIKDNLQAEFRIKTVDAQAVVDEALGKIKPEFEARWKFIEEAVDKRFEEL